MKKLQLMIVLFALVFVVMSHAVFAEIDIFYPGASSSIEPVPAGATVDYEYVVDDTYSAGESVHRVIELLDAGLNHLSTLVDETTNGFYYGTDMERHFKDIHEILADCYEGLAKKERFYI